MHGDRIDPHRENAALGDGKLPANGGQSEKTPIALTIAGSDSGGGAGIQADLKAFSALSVYGASVITALTAQNTQAVNGIHDVPPDFIVNQLETVLSDLDVSAIKIGMLSTVPIIEAIASVLREHKNIPLVLDPVMVAKSGDRLLSRDAHLALIEYLCPLATVLTPNVPEAAMLSGLPEVITEAGFAAQAEHLLVLGCQSVLLKGGHLDGAQCTDILYSAKEQYRYSHPRLDTKNTHGTGCTLSSAIAACLAHGQSLSDAVSTAELYLHKAIQHADSLSIGHGHGPVHHFHHWWTGSPCS